MVLLSAQRSGASYRVSGFPGESYRLWILGFLSWPLWPGPRILACMGDRHAARSEDRTLPARFLRRAPLWIGIGALLNLAIVQFGPGWEGLGSLRTFALPPVLLGLILAFVPWFTRTLRVRTWSGALGSPLGLRSTLRVVLCSDVLAAVTPTAVGGAPAKATFLYREGLSPGAALTLTALGSLEDGLFFCVSIPLAVWLSPSIDSGDLSALAAQAVRGGLWPFGSSVDGTDHRSLLAAVLATVLALMLLVALALGTGTLWRRRGPGWLERLRLAKEEMTSSSVLLWRKRRRLLLTLPLTAIQWSSRYAVVSCLAWGLGLPVDPFLLYVLQCLVFSVLVLVPSPGATGGAEGAFLLFHQGVAGTQVAMLLLAWRSLTFFIPVGVGAILLLLLQPLSASAPNVPVRPRAQRTVESTLS